MFMIYKINQIRMRSSRSLKNYYNYSKKKIQMHLKNHPQFFLMKNLHLNPLKNHHQKEKDHMKNLYQHIKNL